MEAPEKPILAPHYYRDNFLRLCDTVETQYGDLLSSEEVALLQRFRNLSFEAQCLYVRLVSRTGPWFRESKLQYAELDNIGAALDELLLHDLAEAGTTLSPAELGALYTKGELEQIFAGHLLCKKAKNKTELLCAITALQLEDGVTQAALNSFELARLIAPLGIEWVQQLQVLFFGNRHQSLTEFVLEDLGVTRYFPYRLDREQRLFTCREALEEFLAIAALSDCHQEICDSGVMDQLPELARQTLAMVIRFPSSNSRWHRLCNSLGRDLERQRAWNTAAQLYVRSRRHPARERRARILEQCEDFSGACALCEEILADPWCAAEGEAAARILPRVKRKLDGTRVPRARDNFERMELRLSAGSDCVELLSAEHLAEQWQAVHYVENSLMNTLFGLAFWEQIFQSVPGVFHHAFQSVPTDMYESTFREQRRSAIAARMEQLAQGNMAAMLGEAYRQHQGYQCRWVDWRTVDAALVDTAARIIPAPHLLAIWQRILFDPRGNRSGFPDLIALGSRCGEYCMIEVKGPGDALQDSQKRWLRFFQRQDIPATVAWVEWSGD